jgi:fatty acid desaturase
MDAVQAHEAPSSRIDLDGFSREIIALRKRVYASLGPEDLTHLEKVVGWGRAATVIGHATAWMGPNPVAILGLALGRSTRWILMHHVGHKGYDKVPGVPARFTSKVFARGKRRFLDWPDWMLPDAWIHEHNVMHHSFTGEDDDPDLIERNTEWVHGLPKPVRWALFGVLAATWRASYYAEATTSAWLSRFGRETSKRELQRTLWLECWLPYAALEFVAKPLCYAPLGPLAVGSAAINSVAADIVSNLHTFLVVGPNHAGEDLYRFEGRAASKAEQYLRQVVASVNFRTGGDLNDYLHLWLNYQIEHHLFPDLPMSAYARIQPEVKAICERYGVPYVQESVWTRFSKMARIFVGDAKQRRDGGEVFGIAR